MKEEHFFECQREMTVVDWLCHRGIPMRKAVTVIRSMNLNGYSLSRALVELEESRETFQMPNCS